MIELETGVEWTSSCTDYGLLPCMHAANYSFNIFAYQLTPHVIFQLLRLTDSRERSGPAWLG